MSNNLNSTQSRLNKLKTDLQHLLSQPLTEDFKASLESALISVDNLQTSLEEGEEHRRLAALYQVSQTLGTSLNLDEVLKQVMDAVIGLTGAERGFLMLKHHETGQLELRAGRNVEQKTLQQADMKVSKTVMETVLETQEGIVTTNAQSDPRFSGQDSVIALALRSILCSPLRSRGEIIGVVYVDNSAREGHFTKSDLDLLSAFAAQAAAAIENASRYEDVDQNLTDRIAELETLARASRSLNNTLDINQILEITRKWAIEGTNAKDAWLAMRKVEDGPLVVVTGERKDENINPESQLVAGALDAGTPHVFPPNDGGPAKLVTPILNKNQAIGVLVIESTNEFPAEALQFSTRLTNQAAIAMEKAKLYQDVQQVSDDKSKFVSVVTHELRIPMTSMIGYTDILRQGQLGPVNEKQVEFLNVIRKNVNRMSALVSDLSDISRGESGRMVLEPKLTSMRVQVDDTVKNLQSTINSKSQTLDVQMDESLPDVFADPNRLAQILTNLLSNASKYTPENGNLEIRTMAQGNVVRVEVEDDGLGIGKVDVANVFEQFYRSEEASVREEQGWGLGLSVTKQLVELMGGEIGCESELGVGSTFWFTIPITESVEKVEAVV